LKILATPQRDTVELFGQAQIAVTMEGLLSPLR
jgi:hypothetical protein